MKLNRSMGQGLSLLLLVSLAGACGKKDDNEATSIPATINLTGTMKLGVTALDGVVMSLSGANAPVAGDVVFCVTFAETPTAGKGALASDGKFALTMPGGVALGCFLNSAAGATKATFVFPVVSALGSDGATSIALGADVNFGELIIGADGKVPVTAASIEKSTATSVVGSKTSGIEFDKLHNQTYKLSCVASGDAVTDAACKKDMESDGGSMTVYWRVVKATEGANAVLGVGAWASKASFEACGSIDGTDAEKAAITGVNFSQFTSAAAYTAASACKLREGQGTVRSRETIQDYFMLSQAVPDGAGGYSLRSEGSPYNISATCTTYHNTSIILTGTTDTMFGAFVSEERAGSTCTAAEREQAGEYTSKFNVKFTKM